MVKFHNRYNGLVLSFLALEAGEYKYKDRAGLLAYVKKMRNQMMIGLEAQTEPADYIRIQSMTNMGLLDKELKLSASPWAPTDDVLVLLPPSPTGRVNVIRKKDSQ